MGQLQCDTVIEIIVGSLLAAQLDQYDNVTFLACANALRNLRERGVKIELIPGVRSDETAIDKIIHRLEGGWRYLKV